MLQNSTYCILVAVSTSPEYYYLLLNKQVKQTNIILLTDDNLITRNWEAYHEANIMCAVQSDGDGEDDHSQAQVPGRQVWETQEGEGGAPVRWNMKHIYYLR